MGQRHVPGASIIHCVRNGGAYELNLETKWKHRLIRRCYGRCKLLFGMVARGGIEPPTRGFSVRVSLPIEACGEPNPHRAMVPRSLVMHHGLRTRRRAPPLDWRRSEQAIRRTQAPTYRA